MAYIWRAGRLCATARRCVRGDGRRGEGCDCILIGDHIVLPKTITTPWPYEEYNDGKPNYDIYTQMEWLDPFDTVAFGDGWHIALKRKRVVLQHLSVNTFPLR